MCLLKVFLKFLGVKYLIFFLFERCLEFGLAELEIQCKQSLHSHTKHLYEHSLENFTHILIGKVQTHHTETKNDMNDK